MNYFQKKKLAFMSIVNSVKGFIRAVTGVLPLTLEGCVDEDSIIDYTLYGQSVQNGTPTPDTPIEVESVGEKTRNLFNIDDVEAYSSNNNSTVQKVNGNFVTKRYRTTSSMGLNFKYHFKAGKYALKIDYLNTNYSPKSSYIMYFADKSICVNNSSVGYPNTVKQLNIPKDMTVHIAIYTNDNNVVGNECTFSIMLSEGYEDIPYEPYGYKIPIKASSNGKTVTTNIYLDEPLRKVGDYADYIDFENGKVVRQIKKKQLKNAGALYTIGGVLGFYSESGFLDSKYDRSKGLCNREKSFTETWVNDSGTTLWLGVNNSSVVYWIGILTKLGFTTLAEMNTWLKENETCIYWATNKPTETSIELPPIPTFKGTSIISVDTTIQASNAEIEYYSNVKE